MITATYDPADDKIRLYASSRLDSETYNRVKAAGFRWAPKQDLFFAYWSPNAEDIATELAGELEDEDKSLVERAEERADRFDDYSDKRSAEAVQAKAAVDRIADGIPLGQPILVGHHSERHARKDAERIENGMRRAVKLWETSEYWKSRAKGALRHAKYKELPSVRARRIKTLEAELRKVQRDSANATKFLFMWRNLGDSSKFKLNGEPVTDTRKCAMFIANYDHVSQCFPLSDFPRDPPASQYEGLMGLWSALDGNVITAEQARDIAIPVHEAGNARRARWIAHYENRLSYERAMLDEQGASELLAPKPRPTQLPLLNYRGENGSIITENRYSRGQFETLRQVDMTAAEYAKIYTDYKGTSIVENSHRVRVAIVQRARVAVFITDSKTHEKPAAVVEHSAAVIKAVAAPRPNPTIYRESAKTDPRNEEFAKLKEQAKNGVKVVSAPQLFPTPPDLAARVIAEADIQPGHRVLEPSAGTGALLDAIPEPNDIVAIETNHNLADVLRSKFPGTLTFCADFLTDCGNDETTSQIVLQGFDRIVMNPPFADQQDIKHVTHAIKFLKPGGRLVAIMSNGVTFREDRLARSFRALVDEFGGSIEALPDDAFKSAGTMVRTVLVTLQK